MTAEQLVKIINRHSIAATITEDGKIEAVDQGMINGVPVVKLTKIEPTLQAVRDWLGY